MAVTEETSQYQAVSEFEVNSFAKAIFVAVILSTLWTLVLPGIVAWNDHVFYADQVAEKLPRLPAGRVNMVKILRRLFVLAVMFFAACQINPPPPSGITNAPSPLPTKTQGPNQSSTTSSKVPSFGGTVQLPSIASLIIPDGFLQGNQLITVSARSSPETAAEFDTVGELYNVSFRSPYEVRVNIGRTPPQIGQVKLTLNLPGDFLSAVPAGGSVVAFAQQDMSGDMRKSSALMR